MKGVKVSVPARDARTPSVTEVSSNSERLTKTDKYDEQTSNDIVINGENILNR